MKLAIQLRSPFPIDAPSFSTVLSHLACKTPGAVSRLLVVLQTSPHSLGTIVHRGKRADRADELRDQEGAALISSPKVAVSSPSSASSLALSVLTSVSIPDTSAHRRCLFASELPCTTALRRNRTLGSSTLGSLVERVHSEESCPVPRMICSFLKKPRQSSRSASSPAALRWL